MAESRQVVEIETDRLRAELDALVPMQGFEQFELHFHGFFSMLDAAALNYLLRNQSHWRCSLCNLLPREFALGTNGEYQIHRFALDPVTMSILRVNILFSLK